MQEQELAHLID